MNIVVLKELHPTDLLAPIGAKASEGIALNDFKVDVEVGRVVHCPIGQAPLEHRRATRGEAVLAVFATIACRTCPVRAICPTQDRGGERILRVTPADLAVAHRRVQQETPEFKERHKIRSGIEATNSEAKRSHGLGKLRVRRRPRVSLAVKLKALAVNFKRYVAHLTEAAAVAAQIATCDR